MSPEGKEMDTVAQDCRLWCLVGMSSRSLGLVVLLLAAFLYSLWSTSVSISSPGQNQSSSEPQGEGGSRRGLGGLQRKACGNLIGFASPLPLSQQRALVLPGLTHRASKTGNNSQ